MAQESRWVAGPGAKAAGAGPGHSRVRCAWAPARAEARDTVPTVASGEPAARGPVRAVRSGAKNQPLSHQDERVQRRPDPVTQLREQLFRPPNALLRIVAQDHADHQAPGRLAIGHLNGLDERAQVVRDGSLTLVAGAQQGRLGECRRRRGAQRVARVARGDDLRAIDGGHDLSRERRLSQPDVIDVAELVAGRQPRLERLPDAPAREPLHQPHVQQLGLSGDRGRERGAGGEPGLPGTGVETGDREAAGGEGSLPLGELGALGLTRVSGGACHHEPPSLHGLAGRLRAGCGAGRPRGGAGEIGAGSHVC